MSIRTGLGWRRRSAARSRFGAKSPYKPFLHHISRTQSLRHAVVRVKSIKRLPRVFSPSEVQSLLDACTRLRDRLLLCLLHESGMRIGQALGLRHADIRSYDGAIDIVPRANSNGALAKSRSPYVVHVSKQAMALYADYLVHEYGEAAHDYVFANWWGGEVGAPMRYATVIDLFRQLSKRAGLKATPHMFRHTHATDLLRAGWDAAYVQRRLGHAHIQTTVGTYAHLSPEDMGDMFEQLSEGACAMSANPDWNRVRLRSSSSLSLQGFWAEDLWDMHHSPAGTLSPNASQRRLRFGCKSAAINGELKYVCWKKFSGGEWRGTQELTKVHLMIRWLNSLNDLPASLMCLSFPEWQALYRKYLNGPGHV